MFGGQLQSTVECQTCHYKSVTFETFWDLSLPIPTSSSDLRSSVSRMSKQPCRLHDCLTEYSKEEMLEEPYKCEKCKKPNKATKRITIFRSPEILVLHLKRFSYTMYSRDKIETCVAFPVRNLSIEFMLSDISPFKDDAQSYDLFATSNHMGGLGGGHYIAYTKNIDTEAWYQMNDSKVSPMPGDGPGANLGSSTYVLFYQKQRASKRESID
ncbi:uncharacterized protein BJ171DRAFT_566518 [Polychytrium aggregatum]|uniref:uncharacterized protein n=1 Tax=Polychytrium aggregatum TaxID=110093 RepID=UPI0022FDC527|nr:uncharacterized protein BJ171DRAFT_566518 [Polychytrium aggregatum]KAI9206643.1 hypothetical protein BJ171DRAFT_566518 [Polychytrium aggregatum]